MKKIFTLIAAVFLALSAQAASDLTLNPSETVAFGSWGFENSGAPTLNFENWAEGGGWQFATPLSQDTYCGVDIAFNATTETHVTFFINYEGGAEQSIDVPTGSTGIKADFAYAGGITKIGFKYGDWEAMDAGGASITITSAVVKANSTGAVTELAFADLSESTEGYTKDAANQTITIGMDTWACYWSFDPAILSDDYEKIVVTFAEAVPVSGLTINAEVTDVASLQSTTLGSITNGATKATAYFSELPGASITKIGFYQDWQADYATLKIAKVELVKKVTVAEPTYTVRFAAGNDEWTVTDVDSARSATAPAVLQNVMAGDSLVVTAPNALPGKVKSVKAVKYVAPTITVDGLVLNGQDGDSWETLVANNPGKIEISGGFVSRLPDGANLMDGECGGGSTNPVSSSTTYNASWADEYHFCGD